jgi:HK97 family phage prohead protease
MKIQFDAIPMKLDAAAGEETLPTITGLAVPWFPASAVVSSGERVAFERGAFDVNQKPAKLIEGHDLSQLVGTVPELIDLEEGLGYLAQFARTTRSNDAIELIRAGAYDAVSVGADVISSRYDKESKTVVVTKANLLELSLVAIPAFSAATIDTLAASAPEEDDETPTPSTNQPEETQEVETPSTPEVAEAATVATAPIYASAKRAFKLPSPAEYIAAMKQGGAEFAALNANIQAAAGDVIVSNTVVPEPIVQPLYDNINPLRPFVSALGPRSMPALGKVFIRPRVVTHTSVAVQSTELTGLSATSYDIEEVQVTKKTFGGQATVSEQAIDWSDPAILNLVLQDLAGQYALATELETCTALAGAISASNDYVITDWTDGEEVVADLYAMAAEIGKVGNYLPTHLVVSPDIWAKLATAADTTGRAIFPQVAPMNAAGQLSGGAVAYNGNPLGLQLVVTNQLKSSIAVGNQDASEFAFMLNARAIEAFETAKGSLSLIDPATLGTTVSFRGYFAAQVMQANAIWALGPTVTWA